MTLQENLRRAPRMLSMWVGTGAVLFGMLPPDQQLAILAKLGIGPLDAPFYLGVLFMLARLFPQKSVT